MSLSLLLDANPKPWLNVKCNNIDATGNENLTGNLVVGGTISGGATSVNKVTMPQTNIAKTQGAIQIGASNVLHAYDFNTANPKNIWVGRDSGSGTSGQTIACINNVGVGLNTGAALTSGASNTFVGSECGSLSTTSTSSVGVGHNALLGLTTGANNVAVGDAALQAAVTSSGNVAIGKSAGILNTASSNTFIGSSSAASSTTATTCVCVGVNSGQAITTGASNIAIGPFAMGNGKPAITGASNNCIGSSSMGAGGAMSGSFNNSLGASSLGSITTGDFNAAVGHQAGLSLTTGGSNMLFGVSAGNSLTTGSANTLIGIAAGTSYTTEANNICLSNAGTVADSGVIRIGTAGTQTTGFIPGIMSFGEAANATNGIKLLNNIASYTPSLLNFYEESYTNSITWSNAINASSNVRLAKVGKMVIAEFSLVNAATAASGTINGVGAIPARFRPTQALVYSVLVDNNTTPGITQFGIFNVSAAGDIVIYGTELSTAFGAGGNTGFHAISYSWTTA